MRTSQLSVITNDDHRSHDPGVRHLRRIDRRAVRGAAAGRLHRDALRWGPFAMVDSTSHGLRARPARAQPRARRLLVDRMEGLHHGPPRCAGRGRRGVHPPGLVEACRSGVRRSATATAVSGGSASTRRHRSARARGPQPSRRPTSPCRASIGCSAGERIVYSLCRPPGHHATRSAFGGFCLLNNAAIAAQALIDAGCRRVTVLDVDAHHGNGTQQIFYQRGDVQFVSIHMDPEQNYPWFVGRARRAWRWRAVPGPTSTCHSPRNDRRSLPDRARDRHRRGGCIRPGVRRRVARRRPRRRRPDRRAVPDDRRLRRRRQGVGARSTGHC